MKNKYLATGIALALFCGVTAATKPDPAEPLQRAGAEKHHAAFLARAQQGNIGLLLLGDSITAGWGRADQFKKYQPANFGVSGDRTEHVLWRITNGELDGIHPKVVLLLIGTNNTGKDSADDIARADKKIIEIIQTKLPQTKVLLMGIFPRGPVDDLRRALIRAVNKQLARLDDGQKVRYLDIGEKLLNEKGDLTPEISHDKLHLTAKGYEIWAAAVTPLLDELMK